MTPSPSAPPAGAPEHRTADVPWAGMRAVPHAVAIYLITQPVVLLLAMVVTGGGDWLNLAALVLSPVVMLAVGLAWLWLWYRDGWKSVRGRRGPRRGDVAVGLGIGVACFVGQRLIVLAVALILSSAGVQMPVVQEMFQEIVQRPGGAPLLVLTSVALAPVAEEVVFRGVLFQGLRARSGFWPAALLSAALFTLVHFGEGGGWLSSAVLASGILPLGVVFAALLERRGSLLAPITAHAAYNAINVTLLILTVGLG